MPRLDLKTDPGSQHRFMKILLHLCLAACLLLTAVAAQGQGAPSSTIQEIEIAGARTVGSKQVLAWSGFEEGQALTRDMTAQGIRNLFATKKFSDVFIYAQEVPGGVKLIINLVEFPRIRSIHFQGNDKVKSNDLREAFPVHVGQFANPAAINRDLQPLKELYYEKGYYNVAMHTDSTRVDANNMEDLVVSITEGDKVKVQTIAFEGNDNVRTDDLRDAMEQGTRGFLRSGTFKKDVFEEDKERIITRFRNEGYLDATVDKVDLNFREEEPEKLDIVIHVTEGPLYTTGEVTWDGNEVFNGTWPWRIRSGSRRTGSSRKRNTS